MGRKNKLRKFAEILSFPNVYECYNVQQPALVGAGMAPVDLKGKWNKIHFVNDNPIVLELACGGGEYTVGLARQFPDRNFIGVDVKGNRLWKGAKTALEQHLANAAFLRTRIEIIEHFFAPGEVSEIWITFPDPFPRASKENRRLTSPFFHEKYRQILRPGGLVHLKHDDPDFYQFTLDTIAADPLCTLIYNSDDIYAGPLPYPELAIQTLYESHHLAAGKKIKYVRYKISQSSDG
ncbi:MAG: tRNA (guanosine(46)-N7)-methyltransferase TrmB [Haliscomenobacteraceae bacterium CHB4]|nr:tRNA (guanosine(46)-N7)-methyltransferase TrmB [Haliscomenobacteraceae bacterium CHB4]